MDAKPFMWLKMPFKNPTLVSAKEETKVHELLRPTSSRIKSFLSPGASGRSGALSVTSLELSLERTKLANQRTYLAYMRTGFAIAAIAGSFQKYWIAAFGILMLLGSMFQYFFVNRSLSERKNPSSRAFDLFPLVYVVLSVGAIFLQMS